MKMKLDRIPYDICILAIFLNLCGITHFNYTHILFGVLLGIPIAGMGRLLNILWIVDPKLFLRIFITMSYFMLLLRAIGIISIPWSCVGTAFAITWAFAFHIVFMIWLFIGMPNKKEAENGWIVYMINEKKRQKEFEEMMKRIMEKER